MIPPFLIFTIFIGGVYLALDTTSGERERGSLEPLLINPLARWEFMMGKVFAALAFTIGAVLPSRTARTMAAIYPVIGPLLLGVMLSFAQNMFRPDKAGEITELELAVEGQEYAPELMRFLERKGVVATPAPADMDRAVRDGSTALWRFSVSGGGGFTQIRTSAYPPSGSASTAGVQLTPLNLNFGASQRYVITPALTQKIIRRAAGIVCVKTRCRFRDASSSFKCCRRRTEPTHDLRNAGPRAKVGHKAGKRDHCLSQA